MSLCEKNCSYEGYDIKQKKSLCDCYIKIKMPFISEIIINKDKLLRNFMNIKYDSNFHVIYCFSLLFSNKGIIYNIGSYILLIIIFIHIICTLLFIIKGHKNFLNKINNILESRKNINKRKSVINNIGTEGIENVKKIDKRKSVINNIGTEEYPKIKDKRKSIIKNKRAESTKKINKRVSIINNKKTEEIEAINVNKRKTVAINNIESSKNVNKRKSVINKMVTDGPNKESNSEKKIIILQGKIKKNIKPMSSQEIINLNKKRNSKAINRKRNSVLNNKLISQSKSENNFIISKKNTKQSEFPKTNDFNDYEINNLFYKEALIYDKRTYIQYYISLLRNRHLIIFTFYTNNDYNSREIKICLFFFSFSLLYTMNALFFRDSTMHKIYVEEGIYNFIYQIPYILCSTIINNVICSIIRFLSLTEKDVVEIKNEKSNQNQKLKCIKIKFIFFFILSFLFDLLFWYYLSCFCAVYINTQKHLISDTLISFGLSLTYPLLIYLIPGLFRIHSLKNPKENYERLYNFSKFLQAI
jgi:hypothetical protein